MKSLANWTSIHIQFHKTSKRNSRHCCIFMIWNYDSNRKYSLQVRIYNAETRKETCATYPVEEHVSCGCCNKEASDCASPRVYVPRKCSCQCPNMEERRDCLKKVRKTMDVVCTLYPVRTACSQSDHCTP